MARTSSARKRHSKEPAEAAGAADAAGAFGAELSYSEAHTALELVLAELQDINLPVESMTELYQRARGYAERCEQLLSQVEQTVELWDAENPQAEPTPYAATATAATPA